VTTVVGLDLSLTATGIAFVDGVATRTGTVRSVSIPNAKLADRHHRIRRIVEQIVALAESADLIVLEGPSYGSSSVGSWDRAWLYGAAVDALVDQGHRVAVAPPSVLKKWATNNGGADKTAVAAAMARLWPDAEPRNDNEFDALALATMGAQQLYLPVPVRAHHSHALTKVEWPANVTTKEKQ
jgi:crossover junction endodeoxyribonuclease RuvC